MDSQVTTTMRTDPKDVGQQARRRVAYRLLPFVFLLYIVNYIDRVNVSFANLRMSADLGFSDRMYGLGVGMFYVTYVLFEIPGAIIVERWSARKWTARIMISWGIVTILTGFVQTAGQFYAARFLLGAAESSFFPGMIVYLTHWFSVRDRSRAIACFYAANPAASLVGSPLAGWVLGVHWQSLAGWRWGFILEGSRARLALAVYPGGNPCRHPWNCYLILHDRPARPGALAPSRPTELACREIARGTAGEKEDSKPHNHGSVLRPANSPINLRLFPGTHRSARNHLLDPDVRKTPFGIL